MPRPAGAHTAYRPTNDGNAVAISDIRTFTTLDAALLFAVRANPPMKYVYWPFGVSLADAIAADEAEQLAAEQHSQHRAPRGARPSSGNPE